MFDLETMRLIADAEKLTRWTRWGSLPARLAGHVITTSLGKATSVRNDDDLRHIWNHILDRPLTEPDRRSLCGPCVNTITYQFRMLNNIHWATTLENRQWAGIFTPHGSIGHEGRNTSAQDIFPNLNKLLWIIITLPMTSCSVERLLSIVGVIKTDLRTSMSSSCLNNLSFEKALGLYWDHLCIQHWARRQW